MIKLYDYINDSIGWQLGLEYSEPVKVNNQPFLQAVAEYVLGGTASVTSPLTKTESNLLFCSYILSRYKNWYVSEDFIRQFANVLVRTYDNYKTLIDIYDSKRNSLMDGVKIHQTNTFNDTPQDYGTFTDNSHTTNVTKVETDSDANTLIERISEISRKIEDIYQNWADEFIDLFICPQKKEN